MDQTQIATGRPIMVVSVCLFIFALSAAIPGAQNKGGSSQTDKPRASTQPQESEIKTPDGVPAGPIAVPSGAADSKLPCDQQSAVSELGCSQPKRISSEQPSEAEGRAATAGAFRWAVPRKDLWANEPSLEIGRTAGTFGYRQTDSFDIRRLSEQADDPLSSVASLTFETSYRAAFQGMKGVPGQTQTIYRYSIPLSIKGTLSVLHVNLPDEAATVGRKDGRGDVEVVDLLGFSNKWGRWGAGPAASFGSSHGFGIDTFRAGPALAFVTTMGRWQIGALNRNLFSRSVAVSSIRPVIAYQVGDGWSVGAGGLEYNLEWRHRRFDTVPVGFQLGKVVERGSRYLRFSVAPQYNVRSAYGVPRWTVTMGVAILGPNE